jgi:hypothetical protein
VLTRWVTHDRGDGVRGMVGTGRGTAATTRRWCGRPMDGRPCAFWGGVCAWRAWRRHEKGAKCPTLPSRLRRTRAGVHACECRGPHACERRGGAVARNVPPWLEGRGVHREKGNAVLTDGSRGPSGEGVGEEVCDAVTRKEAALVGEADGRRDEEEAEEAGVAGVLGSRGSGSSRAAPASLRVVLLRAPPCSSFSSPSPSPPACG